MKKIFSAFAFLFVIQASGLLYSQSLKQVTDYSTFNLYKSSTIKPEGWLHDFLEFQRNGLTGHIEQAGFPFNTGMWTERINEKPEGVFWWPYEQTGYYVDGCIKTGYLLNDTLLLNKAKHQINYTLLHPQKNGRLGPDKL